jgi:hypothetical protein
VVIPASALREGHTVIQRTRRGAIRRRIPVEDVSRDCGRGGTHINQLSLRRPPVCFDAMAVVEVR